MFRSLQRHLPAARSDRRALLDLVVIFGLALVVRVITYPLDLFERFAAFSRGHESWQMDELALTIVIASLAFIVYGFRRAQDMRRELKLRLAAEEHATILALQDPLTGLPNRRRFVELLDGLLAHRNRCDVVAILDLDGFKPVNDVFGHASGDEALRTIAQRMKAIGDERVVAARLGGDEFALILRNLTGMQEAERIAQRLIAAIEIPIASAGLEHRLEASLGIAEIGRDVVAAEEMLRRADVALYAAKAVHGSSCVVYDATLDKARQESVHLERDLRAALAEGAIVPHYQPIVDLRTGDVVKLEALARWRHPTRGDVPPTVFVPLAEARGMIAEITERILRRACADAVVWPAQVMLSVNISPLLLADKSFHLRLVRILSDTRFPARRLQLEITERALKADYDQVRAFLDNLRALGVRIALDDFGTGYSSLSRLRKLPFDDVKIDRSFVQSLEGDSGRTAFVRTIMQLGHGLGMSVTAEGIEEPAQRALLLEEGCTLGQGFLFSEAVPAGEVAALLRSPRHAAGGTSA